jgi:hypothetical protein
MRREIDLLDLKFIAAEPEARQSMTAFRQEMTPEDREIPEGMLPALLLPCHEKD